MRKVGIIGLGHVGETIAYTLVSKGTVDQLVLIDVDDKRALAQQYDLVNTITSLNTSTKIIIQDYAALKNADVIITSFRSTESKQNGNLTDDFASSVAIAQQVGEKIKSSEFNGVIINVNDPNEASTAILQKTVSIPQNQVFGIGTCVETQQIKSVIAEQLQVSPHNVSGFVYGERGESNFIAWSTFSVSGRSMNDIHDDYQLNFEKLEMTAKQQAWSSFSGRGYSSFSVATCTVKLIQAVLSDERLVMPVAVYHPEIETYISYPAIIGLSGIRSLMVAKLTDLEQGQLISASNFIKQKIESLSN